MKQLLTILLLIGAFGKIACNDSKKKLLQSVTLDFAFFKSPYTSFTLDFNTNILTCKNFGYNLKVDETTNKIIPLYVKDYKLSSKSTAELNELFSKYIPDTLISRGEGGSDGGGFQISYVRPNKDTAKLTVGNPIRNNKDYMTDFEQIDKFFEIAYTVVTDSLGINTLDETNEVYFSGLPIRKISEQPLSYKIWGGLSGCRDENKQLVNFFNGLTKEKCVVIEVGERKLSYCLTEVIAEFSLKSNIHFVSKHDLPWLWTELNDLKKQVLEAKQQNKTLEKTSENGVFLRVYLEDSAILNKWLNIPKDELFKSKEELEKTCN